MSVDEAGNGLFADYRIVLGDASRRLPLAVAGSLGLAALDLLAVALVAPFTAAMLGQEVRLFEVSFGLLGDANSRIAFGWLGGAIVLVFLFKTLASHGLNRWIARFAAERRAGLMVAMLRSLQARPYAWFLQRNTVDVGNRLMHLCSAYAGSILTPSMRLLVDGIVALALSTLLLWRDPPAFLLLLGLLALVFAWIGCRVRPALTAATDSFVRTAGQTSVTVAQALGAVRELRLLGGEQYFQQRLAVESHRMADELAVMSALTQLPRLVTETAVVVFLVLLSWLTLWRGQDLVGLVEVLGMFAVAALRMMPAATSILTSWTTIRAHRSQLRELAGELGASQPGGPTQPGVPSPVPFGSLKLQAVGFRYEAAAQPALLDATLEILRGQVVGVRGRSGAGKSTLADLVLGLLQPQSGQLLLDGRPLSGAGLAQWQRQCAYIPQAIFITDDTLRRNIALGVPDAQIDPHRLAEAVQQSQLEEVVAGLAQGLDTPLGERGVRLSGGQRQRVAIARALYHDRAFIVLDEATSALDAETEREVVAAIRALHGQRTLLVIAHKESLLAEADVVVDLVEGRIVAITPAAGMPGESA